ncbi:hypothetical protein P5E80_15715, partial [Clostridium perfringens]|nr:hypothetical protein [Clostridium perfringens]
MSILQQPIAQLQQQKQLLPALSQLAMVNPVTYLQQQVLPSNPQAVVNAAAYLQQQQLQQILP